MYLFHGSRAAQHVSLSSKSVGGANAGERYFKPCYRDVESGACPPEFVVNKLEQVIEVISALSNQDVDPRVIANLEEVLQRFSNTTTQLAPGHIPSSITVR